MTVLEQVCAILDALCEQAETLEQCQQVVAQAKSLTESLKSQLQQQAAQSLHDTLMHFLKEQSKLTGTE